MTPLDEWLYELDAYRPTIQAHLQRVGRFYGHDCFDEAWQELLCWCWRNEVGRDGFAEVRGMESWLCARIKKLCWQIKASSVDASERRNETMLSQLESGHGHGAFEVSEYGTLVRCPPPDERGFELLTPLAADTLSMTLRGYGAVEIGRMCGLNKHTAKRRVSNARKQYRRRLAKYATTV